MNISAYRFARLSELKVLRARLLEQCKASGLKGTILISTEGVNLFVAGAAEAVEELLETLRALPGLEDLSPKYSRSAEQPFRRMLVRIKKEIIAFGVPGIDPVQRPSPKLSPTTLKQWLDEGRAITLLDTRNDYEVKLGTFRGAIPAGIDTFRDFPGAVKRLPESMKSEAVVMFCTGGIRCEKAGPFMEREGFKNIYQLDGWILKYFEECGGVHYDGECFVFDQRVGVDPGLKETETTQCFVCQAPLTAKDQSDARYVVSQSCPNCYQSEAEKQTILRVEREEKIRSLTTPLPGSRPYCHRRPVTVPAPFDGHPFAEFLTRAFPQHPREYWRERCQGGDFVDNSDAAVTAEKIVRAGERFFRKLPATVEPDVNGSIKILHEDEAIVVIDKPAPLPVHSGGRYHRNTLQWILSEAYAPYHPRPAHRLDANTTGVMVFSRSHRFAKTLQSQFAGRSVEKTYLVIVRGHPPKDFFVNEAPIDNEPGPLGTRGTSPHGLPARTEFRVLARHSNGQSLLEARPITGRTNQIRIHLWHLGWPVCGDPAYLPHGQLGDAMTLSPSDPPMKLHAWKITFDHPLHRARVAFEAPVPDAFQVSCPSTWVFLPTTSEHAPEGHGDSV
ncbi:MAG: RluA family pseudouridine synthase [Terrimicrobiaceae bacterium]